ncbi:MAG: sodium:solute symporter, partial [Firmicutes bacterium]|nr:sodium:solute symporter [Bacillota bacterium]
FGDVIEYNPANGTPIYDSIVPSMLSVLPDVLIAVVVMLVLSASMSTLSSLVLTSSSVLTLDLVNEAVKEKMDEKKSVLTMRGFVIVYIMLSAVIALIQYKSSVTFIAQLMGISWGALAGAFLGPFLYSLYWKKVTRAAVWASFACGVGLTTGNMILGMMGMAVCESPINCGAAAMILSLIIVPAVSMITPKPDSTIMDQIFGCYDEKVEVSRKNALED